MKAGSSFQKKRPSWPVCFNYVPAAAGRHIFFNNAAASAAIRD
jgi:hypothetical protein